MRREFYLMIADECLAAWAPFNNAFTAERVVANAPAAEESKWSTEKHYWNGIIVQLGHRELIKYHKEMPGAKTARPYGVFLLRQNETKLLEIPRKMFEDHGVWVNVVPTLNSGVKGGLDGPVIPADKDEIFPIRKEPGMGEEVGKPKAIHKFFHPCRGGITIWQDWRGGDGGWDLRARQDANGGTHNKYTFRFRTEVTLAGDDGVLDLAGFKVEVIGHPDFPGVKSFPDPKHPDPDDVVAGILISGSKDLPSHGDGSNPPQKP